MKKLLYLISLMSVMLFASCKDKDFTKTVAKDYEEVVALHPNTEGHLREVQCVLNDTIAKAETLYVAEAMEVFQNVDTANMYVVFRYKDIDAGTTRMILSDGIWVGSGDFKPSDLKVSLASAIKIIKDAELPLPETTFLTIRRPLTGDGYEHPLYIFGSVNTFFVAVDAVTGSIFTFDNFGTTGVVKLESSDSTFTDENGSLIDENDLVDIFPPHHHPTPIVVDNTDGRDDLSKLE